MDSMKLRLLIAVTALLAGLPQAYAATITVASTNDSGPGILHADGPSGGPSSCEAASWHHAKVTLKKTGTPYLKGKDYIVEDGDFVHIRHSG